MKQNVVRFDGDGRNDLEIKTNAHAPQLLKRGLCQKTIVIGFAVAESPAVAIESHAGNEGEVYAFERCVGRCGGFEEAKHTGTEVFASKVAADLQLALANGRQQEGFLGLPTLYDGPHRHFVGHIGIKHDDLGG